MLFLQKKTVKGNRKLIYAFTCLLLTYLCFFNFFYGQENSMFSFLCLIVLTVKIRLRIKRGVVVGGPLLEARKI